jgi:hypothetical protein
VLKGIPAFIPIMLHDIELNLGEMDAIVIPISFLLCLLLTRSFRLLLLSAVSMIVSLAFTFAVTAVLAI